MSLQKAGSLRKKQSFMKAKVPKVALLGTEDVFRMYQMPGPHDEEEMNRNHVPDALSKMGIDVPEQDIDMTFQQLDKEGTGSISFEEFCYIVEKYKSQGRFSIDDLREMLDTFDENGDGSLDATEFANIWRGRMTDSEIRETMIAADSNMDGQIDFSEFVYFMCPDMYEQLEGADPNKEIIRVTWERAAALTQEALVERRDAEQSARSRQNFAQRLEDLKRDLRQCEKCQDDSWNADSRTLEDWAQLCGVAQTKIAQGKDWNAHVADMRSLSGPSQGRPPQGAPTIDGITAGIHEYLQRAYQWISLVAQRHNFLPPGLLPFVEEQDWQVDTQSMSTAHKEAPGSKLREKWQAEERDREQLRAAYCAGFFGEALAPSASGGEREANRIGLLRRLDGGALALQDGGDVSLVVRGRKSVAHGVWTNAPTLNYDRGDPKDPPPEVSLARYLHGRSVVEILGCAELPSSGGAGLKCRWVRCSGCFAADAAAERGGLRDAQQKAEAAGSCGFVCNAAHTEFALIAAGPPASIVRSVRQPGERGVWGDEVWVAEWVDAEERKVLDSFDAAYPPPHSPSRTGSIHGSPQQGGQKGSPVRTLSARKSFRKTRAENDRERWAQDLGGRLRDLLLAGRVDKDDATGWFLIGGLGERDAAGYYAAAAKADDWADPSQRTQPDRLALLSNFYHMRGELVKNEASGAAEIAKRQKELLERHAELQQSADTAKGMQQRDLALKMERLQGEHEAGARQIDAQQTREARQLHDDLLGKKKPPAPKPAPPKREPPKKKDGCCGC